MFGTVQACLEHRASNSYNALTSKLQVLSHVISFKFNHSMVCSQFNYLKLIWCLLNVCTRLNALSNSLSFIFRAVLADWESGAVTSSVRGSNRIRVQSEAAAQSARFRDALLFFAARIQRLFNPCTGPALCTDSASLSCTGPALCLTVLGLCSLYLLCL